MLEGSDVVARRRHTTAAGGGDEAPSTLTDREAAIVILVARGLVNKEIAASLGISEATVKTHLRRAFSRLHVSTRAELVARALGELAAGPH